MQASSPADAPVVLEPTELVDGLAVLLKRLLLDPKPDEFRAIEELDLTVSQVRALKLIACSDPEPLSGGRIAEQLGVSPAAISRALDGLVRRGLLARTESPEDRRVRPFAITGPGRSTAGELSALRRGQLEHFVRQLDSRQRDRLGDALEALNLTEGTA